MRRGASFFNSFIVLGALAALPLVAQPIELLSIDTARFGSGWTLNGSNMEYARTKLLSPDNFGIGGVIDLGIAITDTAATIDAALLAGVDIVFIGYFNDESPNAFSDAELDALFDWVSAGGAILVTCDSSSYDAVCARFGVPSTGSGGYFVSASGAGFGHPATAGPFGDVRQVAEHGTRGTFDEPDSATVLMRNDSTGDPVVLAEIVGSGRMVAMSDVDLLSDNTLSDGTGVIRPNDALLGNAIAWLSGEFPGGACLPDNTTLCIDDVEGDGRFRITIEYDTVLGGGLSGDALASPLSAVGADKGGLFSFFDPATPEVLVKVLNGCGLTDHYWIYFSAGTNAGFGIKVEDLILGGAPWTYENPDLTPAPAVQDIYALPCS